MKSKCHRSRSLNQLLTGIICFCFTTSAFAEVTTESNENPTGQSQISADTIPQNKKKKATFAFNSANYLGVESASKNQGEVTAFNQLRMDLKLSDLSSVRVNQIFSNGWGAKNNSQSEFKLGDIYLQYSQKKLADLPAGIGFNGYGRIYLPLSELSQTKGQQFSISFAGSFEKELSKETSISFNLIPFINLQSKDSYEAENPNGSKTRKLNNSSSLWYYLSGGSKLTKKLSFTQDLGLMRYWFKSDQGNGAFGKTKEFLYADTSLTYALNDTFEIAGGLSSFLARDLLAQTNQFAIYRLDETDYYVSGTVQF